MLTSTDAGKTWAAVDERFSGSAVVDLAFSPRFAENGTLLAGTTGDGIVAVYRSTDRGASWSRYVQLEGAYHWASLAIPDAEPDDEEFFCLATGAQVLRPSGTVVGHWNAVHPGGRETAIRSVVASLDFEDDDTLFAATSAGLLRSSGRGRLWYPSVAELDGTPLESWLLPAMPRVGKCCLPPRFTARCGASTIRRLPLGSRGAHCGGSGATVSEASSVSASRRWRSRRHSSDSYPEPRPS